MMGARLRGRQEEVGDGSSPHLAYLETAIMGERVELGAVHPA